MFLLGFGPTARKDAQCLGDHRRCARRLLLRATVQEAYGQAILHITGNSWFWTRAELGLIKTVYRRCAQYFDRDVNYEDVAYVIWQVSNEQTRNYENPAIVPLLQQLRKSVPRADLTRVAADAYDYISCVVSSMLYRQVEFGHVPLLIDVGRTASFRRIEIFTLNHDTLIEQELQRSDIPFSDGFELYTPTCRYWDATLSRAPNCRVKLYKLHGSIDWFRYRPDPVSPNRQLVGRALNGDFEHTLDFSGKRQRPLSPISEMLIGSFNKILDYSGHLRRPLLRFPGIAARLGPLDREWLRVSRQGRQCRNRRMAQEFCH